MQKSVNSPSHLIYLVLTVFVIINLFVPGEKNNLVFLLSQLIVYGFAGVHIVYLSGGKKHHTLRMLSGLLFLALLISYINSFYQYDTLKVSLQLFSMILLAWLISQTVPDERKKRITLIALVFTGVVVSLYGLLQLFTFFAQAPDSDLITKLLPVSNDYLNQVFTQKRIFATFLLPTSLSAFIAMVLPLAGGLAVEYRNKLWAVALIILAMIIMVLALIQTQSNGGAVALMGGLGLGTLIILRDKKLPVGWILLGITVLGLGAIFAIGFIRGNYIWDLSATNSPIRLRWLLWQAGIAMAARYGLTGIGAGNFHLGFFPYVGGDVRPTKFLHNTYLQVPIEFGVIGLIVLLVGLYLLAKRLLARKEQKVLSPYKYGIIVAIMVFLVANLFEIVVYFHSLGYLGAFVTGLFLSESRSREAVKKGKADKTVFALSCGVACVMAMLLIGKMYLSDHFYNKASDEMTSEMVGQNLSEGLEGEEDKESDSYSTRLWEEEIHLLEAAIALDGSNYRYHLLLAQILERNSRKNSEAEIERILEEYRIASELSPKLPNLHYTYGLSLIRNQKIICGAGEIAQAARLYLDSEEYQKAEKMVNGYMKMVLTGRGSKE